MNIFSRCVRNSRRYALRHIERRGKSEGALGPAWPTTDTTIVPALEEFYYAASGAACKLALEVSEQNNRLKDTYLNAGVEADETARTLEHKQRELERAEDEYFNQTQQQPPAEDRSGGLYIFACVLASAAEMVWNYCALQVFGQPSLATLVIACGVSVCLLVLAHLSGRFAHYRNKTAVWLSVGAAFAGLLAIAVVRTLYLAEDTVLQRPSNLPAAHSWLTTAVTTICFLLLNSLCFTAMALLSWWKHMPLRELITQLREDIEALRRHYKRARKLQSDAFTKQLHLAEQYGYQFDNLCFSEKRAQEVFAGANIVSRRRLTRNGEPDIPGCLRHNRQLRKPVVASLEWTISEDSTPIEPVQYPEKEKSNEPNYNSITDGISGRIAAYHRSRRAGSHRRMLKRHIPNACQNGATSSDSLRA